MDARSSRESSDPPGDRSATGADGVYPAADATADGGRPKATRLSLFGRLFAVPFLIVGTIVGGAVLVVLLFASPASPEQHSVESLLQALESSSGQRSMGLLLPREKELWQMALELSLRLGKKERDAQLTDAQLKSIAVRLGTMIQEELAHRDRFTTVGMERANQQAVRSRRLEFVIQALGKTERPEAVAPLLSVLRSGHEPYSTVAMGQLGELHTLPDSRQAIRPIIAALNSSSRTETRLVACTVLSVLATPGDQQVIDALADVRLSSEGEVAWSAALALARLGSGAGKSTLLDLLDRSFLESDERHRVTDLTGVVRRYPLPPNRVDELLIAAMDAASHLDDAEVWEMIVRLESDPSPAVRGRAATLVKARVG